MSNGKIRIEEAEKAVRTIMIGALYRIETKMGYLWANEKEDNDPSITDAENDMYDIFMELRESILDFGNEQICKIKGIKWEKKDKSSNE